jgi:uncharacterized protein (DUF488 family)
MQSTWEGLKNMMTIGHSTLPIEAFLQILKENTVRILVDVRTIPASRHNPQFAQAALTETLRTAGLEYRWQKSLGGLRRPKKGSPNTGWRNTSFRGYADYMLTTEFHQAIDELLATPSQENTVIMCAEAVPWRCHRSLIGDALIVRGVPVEDIFYQKPSGEAAGPHSHRKPHQLTSFARVEGTEVWYPAPDDLFAAGSRC